MTPENQLRDQIEHAISDAMNHADGSMLGRWVLTAETIETDGRRKLYVAAQADMATWEVLGMAQHVLAVEATALGDIP